MTLEQKLADYTPSDATKQMVRETPLILLASVVAGGKDTVTKRLLADQPDNYERIVTHTTRLPRKNEGVLEVEGSDYHFIDLAEAERMVDARDYIEAKYVHGNVYGSTVGEFSRIATTGKTAIGDVDIEGVFEYLAIKPDTKAIFLLPPSVDTWLSRLSRRYGDLDLHEAEITKRFETAYQEIQKVINDDRLIMVINDDLATTVERIQQIVDGTKRESSEYAVAVAEHLLDFLEARLSTH